MNTKKGPKIAKWMAVVPAVAVMIGLFVAAASPKSDGYYGKTKVAPKAQVEAHPFDLGRVKLLPSKFERAMMINQKYLLDLDADRMLWPYHERAGLPIKGERCTPTFPSPEKAGKTGLKKRIPSSYSQAIGLRYGCLFPKATASALNMTVPRLAAFHLLETPGLLDLKLARAVGLAFLASSMTKGESSDII